MNSLDPSEKRRLRSEALMAEEGIAFRSALPGTESDILDAADLIYRLHWEVRHAARNDKEPPVGLEPGVVQERHHALNWLIRYGEQGWDFVSTDT